jgi:hypothetical protein
MRIKLRMDDETLRCDAALSGAGAGMNDMSEQTMITNEGTRGFSQNSLEEDILEKVHICRF